ncbi:hypothetical protein NL676_007715 [Syzygium grande]|nr:hypothetical protein NL676_007715 [Syzygium grande]
MASPARSLACLTSTFEARGCSWVVASRQSQAAKQLESRASKLMGGRKPPWPSFEARGPHDRSSSKLDLRSSFEARGRHDCSSLKMTATSFEAWHEPRSSKLVDGRATADESRRRSR